MAAPPSCQTRQDSSLLSVFPPSSPTSCTPGEDRPTHFTVRQRRRRRLSVSTPSTGTPEVEARPTYSTRKAPLACACSHLAPPCASNTTCAPTRLARSLAPSCNLNLISLLQPPPAFPFLAKKLEKDIGRQVVYVVYATDPSKHHNYKTPYYSLPPAQPSSVLGRSNLARPRTVTQQEQSSSSPTKPNEERGRSVARLQI